MLWNCSSSWHSYDYKVHKQDNGPKGEEAFKPLRTNFTVASDFNNYRLQRQAKKYDSHILEKIAKSNKKTDIQIKLAAFKPSYRLSLFFVVNNSKTASHSRSNHKGAELQLLEQIICEPGKAALSHQVTTNKKNHQPEGNLTTYCQLAYYLLDMHPTDNVIDEGKGLKYKFQTTRQYGRRSLLNVSLGERT